MRDLIRSIRWWYAKRHAKAVLTYHRKYFNF